jgi:hypothetical protein
MSGTNKFPSPYLNVWEAANLLAFGIATENGGSAWRAAEIEKGQRPANEIEREETDRFSASVNDLWGAARAGACKTLGRRKHQTMLEEIPQLFWENGGIDVLGDDGGGAHPTDMFAHDSMKHDWIGLRYLRSEIEGLLQHRPEMPVAAAAKAKSGGSGISTPHTMNRREERKQKTSEKYKRWYQIALEIKGEGEWTRPTEIAKAVAKRESKRLKTEKKHEKGVNAGNIRRRLDQHFPGWSE